MIAERIAQQMDGVAVIDLKSNSGIDLRGYDCLIVGSALYAGMARKEAKAFIEQHADELKAKPLGLFLSGISDNDPIGYLDSNFPKDVVAHAQAKGLLGGVFDPAKASVFEKLIMRMVAKKSTYTDTISDEKIKRFVEAMKQ